MSNQKKYKGNPKALLPLVLFLLLFIGSGLIKKDFYAMPVNLAFVIAGIAALVMNKKLKLEEKVDLFCEGGGEPNIILMCIIFILAGAFAGVARDMGAVDSTVNLGLTILPQNILMAGVFIIGCFISISIGTSMGTIVALTPIAAGISQQTGIAMGICVAAVVGGAMFGDNLSMISDTTISAARTQGCEMKDKFKANFKIVLPAAIVTAIILAVVTSGGPSVAATEHPYNIVKVLPYLAVLIAAIAGMNVMAVLVGGTIFAGIVGMAYGDFDFFGFIASASKGMMGMEDLAMIAILIGGLVEIIKLNGGIDFLIDFVGSRIKSKRGAEFGIAFLVSLVDICVANNTIAIIMTGPLAKDIADEYDIEPKRSASLLDTFSCAFQGMIPYSGQLLAASGLAAISPFAIMKYNFYPYLMLVCAIAVIIIAPSRAKKINANTGK
ncbi:Na+/H+ antiporter NhaC family protein [Clostridium ganghwense]|uniref:Na+/H+ antiporter NhaC family protein n=1 Tax=Clostridium ganghwense TaxID=312089 RepID=A0ABT4CNY5_9CLOT|nr:Na+/H+ antiporter NhaC family protein [Clostridium ganghwense]MCY6370780.1 Na+/H+ antiporter NhaC family protein [Clostridium ganghwense]